MAARSTFRAVCSVSVVVGLGVMACSSSKPLQTRRDAASPDVTGDVLRDTAAPPPDTATAVDDAAPDAPVARDAAGPADTRAIADAPVAADLSPTKDAPAPDAPSEFGHLGNPDLRGDLGLGDDGRDGEDAAPVAPDVGPDAGTDVAAACTPGMNQTCNDSIVVSSVWGTCTPDGTCVCNPGYLVNPSTGRCTTAPHDAATYGDGPTVCTGDFEACGCGCCGGTTSTPVCYYPALGETTAIFQAQDAELRQTTNCATVGCSMGRRYLCCVGGTPEPPGSATYTADSYSGDLDHLSISKVGASCAQLSLVGPASAGSGDDRLALQTNGNWRVIFARFGGCDDGAAVDTAQGILGTLVVRKGTSGCVADVHASLFALAASGEVKTTRLDADGLPLGGMGDSFCLW